MKKIKDAIKAVITNKLYVGAWIGITISVLLKPNISIIFFSPILWLIGEILFDKDEEVKEWIEVKRK